jgi:hypothetical protein
MADKASLYRKHARDCRRLAGETDCAESRGLLGDMERHWEALAEIQDRLNGMPRRKA